MGRVRRGDAVHVCACCLKRDSGCLNDGNIAPWAQKKSREPEVYVMVSLQDMVVYLLLAIFVFAVVAFRFFSGRLASDDATVDANELDSPDSGE
jgi:hypothetical protein